MKLLTQHTLSYKPKAPENIFHQTKLYSL